MSKICKFSVGDIVRCIKGIPWKASWPEHCYFQGFPYRVTEIYDDKWWDRIATVSLPWEKHGGGWTNGWMASNFEPWHSYDDMKKLINSHREKWKQPTLSGDAPREDILKEFLEIGGQKDQI